MRARGGAVLVIAASLSACDFDSADKPPPNVDPLLGCSIECHGDDTSNAPPKSLKGTTVTTDTGIGAHREHLNAAPTWHRQVTCTDCHTVPTYTDAPGHRDGDDVAEVKFTTIAGAGATWSGTSCSTWCHGNTAIGGLQPNPIWTLVDQTQVTCGSCHGRPPPAPHPSDASCASCHPTLEPDNKTFRDPQSHINGIVDVTNPGATGGCTSCHGSGTSSAPPKDLLGNTAPTVRGVGAHAAHLAPSTWHRDIQCTGCHIVPLTLDTPGHRDGDNVAEVRFDTLNPAGAYTAGNATCTNLYCHGNGRDDNGSKSWVTPGVLACGACHSMTGNNMSGRHNYHINEKNIQCSQCHGTVVNANRVIIGPTLHINGVHEVKMAAGTWDASQRRCSNTGCHGTEGWDGD